MTTHGRILAILGRILDATRQGSLVWREDDNGWFTAAIGHGEISFRFLYFEATNQVGADRYMIDFMMPGQNARFACGTEGYDIVLDILGAAFAAWKPHDPDYALKFLEESLSGGDSNVS